MTDKLSFACGFVCSKADLDEVTDSENLISGVSYIIINYIKRSKHLSVRKLYKLYL
jgi:hypothetical protein